MTDQSAIVHKSIDAIESGDMILPQEADGVLRFWTAKPYICSCGKVNSNFRRLRNNLVFCSVCWSGRTKTKKLNQ